MPERGRAAVAVQEALGRQGIVGDDAGREPRRLLVGESHRLVDPVDEHDCHRRHPIRVARPLVPDRLVEWERSVHGASHLEAGRAEELEESGHEVCSLPVDEREIEAVADTEPVQARLGDSERSLA